MGLPDMVRVRLSTESAGSIAIAPVVVQEMATGELLKWILPSTGKDVLRISDILRRGTLVSGASRMRWEGFQAEEKALLALLESFPNPDPTRAFAAGRCSRVLFCASRLQLPVARHDLESRRWFQRESFWGLLAAFCERETPAYAAYSYVEEADLFRRRLSPAEASEVRAALSRIKFSNLQNQLARQPVESLIFSVSRSSTSP